MLFHMGQNRQQAHVIDEIEPPAPLRRKRRCCTKGCEKPARIGAATCNECNAAAFRRWHKKNRAKLKAKRRTAAMHRSEGARAADSARAKLAMAIKRGKLRKGACVECGSPRVTAYIADPAQWQSVVWVCRDHRSAVIHGIEDRARQHREREAQTLRRERLLAAFDALPPDVQATIRERAARGPMGLLLTPEAPLYQQRIVDEVDRL
jgi:hypothetical protein